MEIQKQNQHAHHQAEPNQKGYMGSVKSWDTNEKAFNNSFALVCTFQKKLNRESVIQDKQNFMKHKHFLKVMDNSKKEELR